MIKLLLNNSTGRIEGLSNAQFLDLRDELSSEEEAYGCYYLTRRDLPKLKARRGKVFHMDRRGIPRPVLDKRFRPYSRVQDIEKALKSKNYALIRGYIVRRTTLLGKRGDFPSGLYERVTAWLKNKRLKARLYDLRKRPAASPGLFSLKGAPTPYPEQLDSARKAAKAGRGAIVMPTGTGKSVAMALLIHELQQKVLVVVPKLGLKRQLSEAFTKIFGSLANITVENIDSPRLATLTDFGVLILDESHHAAAATYRKLNKSAWKNIYFRFYYTATPFRSREAEAIILESIIGKVIYRLPFEVAVEKGYICPVEAYSFSCTKLTPSDPTSWAAVYSELVVDNAPRNHLIARLIKNLHTAGQSTLVLVKEVAHGEELSQLTGAAFAHGENEDSDQLIEWFADGKLKTLIATTGVCGEGRDTRAAEWVLICGGGKSQNAFVQQVGRVLRRYPGKESGKVVLFRDESHDWLTDHYQHQVRFLREEFGVEPVEMSA